MPKLGKNPPSRFIWKSKASRAALAIAFSLVVAPSLCAQDLKTDVVPADQSAPKSAAQPPVVTQSTSVDQQNDAASSVGHHRYNSEAERAHDDLLIVEVKSSLAEDGISQGYPVEVDCDHGTITLSGVVASAEDVRDAAEDAADVKGVVGVKNLLKPH
ncbi:MAG TPA: BON domain-containing protein [Candidatus Binataceae bacterium]|jgi:osmotically-inducible protein OsmY|nr:BON domain-containing protein [Candidatus Binataceae bacterium]